MKKIVSLILTFCFILSMSIFISAKPLVVDTNIYVGNTKLEFEKDVLNIDGSTFFPMRELLNDLGVSDSNILWDNDTRTVTVYANNTITIFEIDSFVAVENGDKLTLESKPVIFNGSTYLPIRPVSRACGFNVNYDASTKTIYLNK